MISTVISGAPGVLTVGPWFPGEPTAGVSDKSPPKIVVAAATFVPGATEPEPTTLKAAFIIS